MANSQSGKWQNYHRRYRRERNATRAKDIQQEQLEFAKAEQKKPEPIHEDFVEREVASLLNAMKSRGIEGK